MSSKIFKELIINIFKNQYLLNIRNKDFSFNKFCLRVLIMPLTERYPAWETAMSIKYLVCTLSPCKQIILLTPQKISKINFLLLHRESMILVLTPFNENGSTEWISLPSENPSAVGPCSWLWVTCIVLEVEDKKSFTSSFHESVYLHCILSDMSLFFF